MSSTSSFNRGPRSSWVNPLSSPIHGRAPVRARSRSKSPPIERRRRPATPPLPEPRHRPARPPSPSERRHRLPSSPLPHKSSETSSVEEGEITSDEQSYRGDHYRPVKIRNRPTRSLLTPPPPPCSPPPPPPPPPEDIPPPPVEVSVPHAPNRNLLEPMTRAATPVAQQRPERTKLFRQPTHEEEMSRYNHQFSGTTTLAAYDLGSKLGEGTFGVVTKARELSTNRAVALKKLIMHNARDGVSVTTVREIKILKALDHPNIVPILDMVVERKVPRDCSNRGDVFMVFPFMDHDLCGLLLNPVFKMAQSVAKLFFKQILEGLAYMHANNFVHRDIKTANILVDNSGHVMIADFGLARSLGSEPMPPHMAHEYTNMVVTRWYRAPELLLGDTHYGPSVDMWSMGCVLGEMYHRDPIFVGESDRDQLYKIFARVGAPNKQSWPNWTNLPGFPDAPGHRWDEIVTEIPIFELGHRWGMNRVATDLMVKLLSLDPAKRPTAEEALNHPWFWVDPLPASKGDIVMVESSHEMTSRPRLEPPAITYPVRPHPHQTKQQPYNLHAQPQHFHQHQQQQQHQPQQQYHAQQQRHHSLPQRPPPHAYQGGRQNAAHPQQQQFSSYSQQHSQFQPLPSHSRGQNGYGGPHGPHNGGMPGPPGNRVPGFPRPPQPALLRTGVPVPTFKLQGGGPPNPPFALAGSNHYAGPPAQKRRQGGDQPYPAEKRRRADELRYE